MEPATTGKLCNTLGEMDIGDYIVWKRDGAVHSFGGSIDSYTELPVTGIASSSLPTKHFHYAIKVDTGLLISDRVTEHTISWDVLNASKRIQGLPTTISGVSGVIRSLTGGVAYADENGELNKVANHFGAFPTNNEWNKYIEDFPKHLIQQEKQLNDVWNHNNMLTWTQDTPTNGSFTSLTGTTSTAWTSSARMLRGGHLIFDGMWAGLACSVATVSQTIAGFRPVFEYKEV